MLALLATAYHSLVVVRVEFYAGYRAEERPVRFWVGALKFDVSEILDQWREPGGAGYRVRAGDGEVYLLRSRGDAWDLEAQPGA